MGNSATKGGMSFNKKETDDIKAALSSPFAEAVSRILILKKLFPENLMAYVLRNRGGGVMVARFYFITEIITRHSSCSTLLPNPHQETL